MNWVSFGVRSTARRPAPRRAPAQASPLAAAEPRYPLPRPPPCCRLVQGSLFPLLRPFALARSPTPSRLSGCAVSVSPSRCPFLVRQAPQKRTRAGLGPVKAPPRVPTCPELHCGPPTAPGTDRQTDGRTGVRGARDGLGPGACRPASASVRGARRSARRGPRGLGLPVPPRPSPTGLSARRPRVAAAALPGSHQPKSGPLLIYTRAHTHTSRGTHARTHAHTRTPPLVRARGGFSPGSPPRRRGAGARSRGFPPRGACSPAAPTPRGSITSEALCSLPLPAPTYLR